MTTTTEEKKKKRTKESSMYRAHKRADGVGARCRLGCVDRVVGKHQAWRARRVLLRVERERRVGEHKIDAARRQRALDLVLRRRSAHCALTMIAMGKDATRDRERRIIKRSMFEVCFWSRLF